ncbi:hypothetical protein SAMN03159496_01979 [Rhizobium sp. NFR07]|uniref:hypothetical protein n=1 Tax=Rhizobium sp. NFR07 TaxID=1566262 RepID=UPI0008EB469A|nr:hypothetical protein [Rhizobium sp. NFR07]SFB14799.1 hypothetical protein SAMN03159496_01979 [Rhizobium sp. NFR07]
MFPLYSCGVRIRSRMNDGRGFNTHGQRVARETVDRILVMQRGRIEEERPTGNLFETSRSDYTKRLLSAVPGCVFLAGRTKLAAATDFQ